MQMNFDDYVVGRVSIIIPTYNRAQYIKEAIDSALSQTYKDIEVIVADDGSTDNTAEIIKTIGDSRIKYIYTEHKGFQSKVRNMGILSSSGEYISFLDSDDKLEKDAIETMVNEIKKDKDVGLVYADVKEFGDFTNNNIVNTLKNINSKKKSGYVFESLLIGSFITCLAVLFRRECLDKTGLFDEDLDVIIGEDWAFFLKISYFYKVKHIPKILGFYRMHASNTNKDSVRGANDWIKIVENVTTKLNVSKEIKNKALANAYFARAKIKIGFSDETYKQDLMQAIALDKYCVKYYFLLFLFLMPSNLIRRVFIFLKNIKNNFLTIRR